MLTRRLTAVVASLPLLMAQPVDPGPGECAAGSDTVGRCLVEAIDLGEDGGESDDGSSSGGPADAETDGPATSGDDVGVGEAAAPERRNLGGLPVPGGVGTFGELPDIDVGLDPDEAAAGAAVAPAVLVQRAIDLLTLQPPVIRLSAPEGGFVGVPLWMWIEPGPSYVGPVSATAVAGSARVRATGELGAVVWSMGPPGAEVRCTGPGTPWTGQGGWSPDCGYAYEQRSLPERTGGTGRWTVTATSVWTITWAGVSGGEPVTGEQTLALTTVGELAVGEVQVLVSGGGG